MHPRDLSAHESYEAGRGIDEVARELGRDPADLVKLASNENPHGPSPAAVKAVREHADRVDAYPTAAHADLRAAIADRWRVATDQVWLAAGADGAIDYLCRAVLEPGDRALVPDPGFAYYPMSVRYHHGRPVEYDLPAPDFEQTAETVLSAYDGERIVFLTSPHNPTGATVSVPDVRRVAEETDDRTLVVVDEAYGEYAPLPSVTPLIGGRSRHVEGLHGRREDATGDGASTGDGPRSGERADPPEPVASDRDDVAVLRTFSKAYGLAGLRVGYALVPGDWADAYARINTPFAVNELACRGALAALDDREHVRRSVRSARRVRRRLAGGIAAPVRESAGNFVLVDVGTALADRGASVDGPAAIVTEATKRRGVILRDCTSFGLPGHVRVTCGTREETDRAIAALNESIAAVADGWTPEDAAGTVAGPGGTRDGEGGIGDAADPHEGATGARRTDDDGESGAGGDRP